jgi:Holliday junction resolvasome RuvABC endonuclease subunit
MIIVGMDLSSRTAAMVAVREDGSYHAHDKIEIHVKHTKNRALVCTGVHTYVVKRLQEWDATHVFIEEPVVAGAMNMRSSLLIAQVCGAVLVAAGMERVCQLVPVSSWKKATVGRGNADKQQIREWLDAHHPEIATKCGLDQDLYDAAGSALYGQGLVRRSNDLRSGFHDESRLPGMA